MNGDKGVGRVYIETSRPWKFSFSYLKEKVNGHRIINDSYFSAATLHT
jgi:hypothetical protein